MLFYIIIVANIYYFKALHYRKREVLQREVKGESEQRTSQKPKEKNIMMQLLTIKKKKDQMNIYGYYVLVCIEIYIFDDV